MQPLKCFPLSVRSQVSILTRPGGRVQLRLDVIEDIRRVSFNPHPSRRTGATEEEMNQTMKGYLFQSSPVPEDGCNFCTVGPYGDAACFNPHPSRRTGATRIHTHHSDGVAVSILTRPGGRVQPTVEGNRPRRHVVSILTRPGGRVQRISSAPFCCSPYVSILTRPGGRVQLSAQSAWARASSSFNPHPSRRTGATVSHTGRCAAYVCFNPHPSRRTGATADWGGVRACIGGFNPHPSRRTGATIVQRFCSSHSSASFNPHPSRRTGATKTGKVQARKWGVSILTRPGGRVQPSWGRVSHYAAMFQSSPVPEDGCNTPPLANRALLESVSILTRPGGRVQLNIE